VSYRDEIVKNAWGQIVLGTALAAVVSRAAAEKLPVIVVPQRATQLFDGRELSQWYTWLVDSQYDDPRSVFSIKDGQNGQLVNEASELQPQEGRILLQCEGSEIFFRRLELLPLTETTEP
jgi:hypothetical protein